jgi:hypothetical protein
MGDYLIIIQQQAMQPTAMHADMQKTDEETFVSYFNILTPVPILIMKEIYDKLIYLNAILSTFI